MANADESNPAFRAVMESVLDDERVALASAVGWIRLVVSSLACLVTLRFLVTGDDPGPLLLSSVVNVVVVAAAVTVLLLLRTGRLRRRAGWVIVFVDAPLIGVAQVLQTSVLTDMNFAVTNTLGLMAGLTILSTLSLSRPVVVGTFGWLFVPYVMRLSRLPEEGRGVYLLPTIGVTGGMVVLLVLIGRIRRLIRASRATDLMGKYLLGRKLGSGGMAEVFEATYSPEGGFERRVAVKRILPTHTDNAEMLELFKREAEVGARLNHPSIVQVFDFGRHQGSWFLAMEFIDGVSLRDVLLVAKARASALPLPVVVHLAWQLSEALDYVHTRLDAAGKPMQLVHRDLNPPNIMVTSGGEVKLADFGIALVGSRERLTATGILRGKLGYAAPEQLRDQPYDSRADLFALGVTLHEALTGARLFSATSDIELLRLCLEKPIAPPSTLRGDVPADLDAIIMGLLARDLTERTPSAAEVRRQLMRLPAELLDATAARRELARLVAEGRASTRATVRDPQGATTETRALPELG